jgi:adenylosuccinate synthase
MPQSAQEQIFGNLAKGRPWDEGVDKAAAQGLMAGLATAGGHNAAMTALKQNSVQTQLPANALAYVKRLEQLIECPIDIISTGPDRAETIILHHPFSA